MIVDNPTRVRSEDLRGLFPGLLAHAAFWTRVCRLDGSRAPEDLVQEAVAALLGGAPWPEHVELGHWLRVRIRQIATTRRRHETRFPSAGEAPLAELTMEPSTEREVVFGRVLIWIGENLSAQDRSIAMARAEGATAAEIRAEAGLSVQSYDAARMRIRRALKSMPSELRDALTEVLR